MRPLRPQDTALFMAAIALGLTLTLLAAVAHTVGWHRWCTHPPRHHTHTAPRSLP